MEKVDLIQEKKEKADSIRIANAQVKIKREFNFLESVDVKYLQKEFILAQAKEICNYLTRLNFIPFHAWAGIIKDVVQSETVDFYTQFYIIKTEFGAYEPDMERINSLVLEDTDKEEFPEHRL